MSSRGNCGWLDLGPLIGVDSGKGAEKSKRSEQKKGEKSVQPAGKVLPYDRFETDKMGRYGCRCFASKGGALSMAVACRLAISFYSYHPQKC